MGSCSSCFARRRDTNVPLPEGHAGPIAQAIPEKTFDAAQWSGVVFFEYEFLPHKDFDVASPALDQVIGSLAATALQSYPECSNTGLDKNSTYIPLEFCVRKLSSVSCASHGPRDSCQKRQKVFDYTQEGHVLATKEAPKLEDLGPQTPTDLEISSEKPATE
jgi:hypothetical protein